MAPAATYGTRGASKRKASMDDFTDETNSWNAAVVSASPAKRARASLPPDEEVPAVTVDSPSGSSNDDIVAFQNQRELLSEQPEVKIDPEFVIASVPATPRGRGRGRGRGFRGGRGNGAGRGNGTRGNFTAASSPGPSTFPPKFPATRGRGRGGRVKKSSIPRLQALYDRRNALKQQFKAVAAIQKNALLAVSDEAFRFATDDPKYFEKIPEYQKVINRLKEIYDENMANIKETTRRDYAQCEKDFKIWEQIRWETYWDTIENLREDRLDLIQQRVVYVVKEAVKGNFNLEDKVFYNETVKEIPGPPKMLSQHAMPFSQPQIAIPTSNTDGDTEFEQHPMNWWKALTKVQQVQWQKDMDKEIARQKAEQNKRKRKRKPGSQLVASLPAGGNQDEDDENEDDDEEENEVAEPASSGEQTPAKGGRTPAKAAKGAKGGKGTKELDLYDSDDADEQSLDKHGFLVPRKKNKQNKIRAPAPYEFEPHEVGRTKFKTKTINGQNCPMAYSVSNNQKHWYYPQRATGSVNSAKLNAEDFDENLIKQHNLHPKFGLMKGDSINDTPVEHAERYKSLVRSDTPRLWGVQPTNFGQPLMPTNPIGVIERKNTGDVEYFFTSRSERFLRARNEFDNLESGKKMRDLLAASGNLEIITPTPPPEVQVEEPDNSMFEELVEAGVAAAAEEKRQAIAQPPVPPPVQPPPAQLPVQMSSAAPVTPRRSHGYDPVRDTYQTPYSQPVKYQPPPPPPVPAPGLDMLADAAEFSKGMPPPPAPAPAPPPPPPPPSAWAPPRPSNPYAPPGPPQSMMQSHQFMPGQTYQTQMYAPPPQPQYNSPRAVSGGTFRELRPAPPQNRGPPPQPPRWQTNYGYQQ